MFVLKLLMCVSILISAEAAILYTRQSYTKGKHSSRCATDCIQGKCIVDKKGTIQDCVEGGKKAWQYHTYQRESRHKFCLSRCGKFGEDYDWCFVSNKLDWDFCNPERFNNDLASSVLTETGVPCSSSCHEEHQVYKCFNKAGDREKCHPEAVNFVVAKTINGRSCVSTCIKRGHNYRQCYDEKLELHGCAPPARNYLALMDEMSAFRHHVKRRGTLPKGESHFIQDYLQRIASLKGIIYEDVNENGNSVKSYSMSPAFYGDDPFLPLFVKAEITRHTIPPPNSRTLENSISLAAAHNVVRMGKDTSRRENKDENGHLIAYSLGGPRNVYNFAPQHAYLNRGIPKAGHGGIRVGHSRGRALGRGGRVNSQKRIEYIFSQWYNFEKEIKQDIAIDRICDRAVLTVAVIYEDLIDTPRPIGFAVTQERYDKHNVKYYAVNDAYFSNDPRQGLSG